MKNINDVCVVVQARLSSQRCPNKMLRDFADTTLMDILLNKLVNSELPNSNIICSVFEPELIEVCSKYPVRTFIRSERSAMSEGNPLTEIFEWWDRIPFKNVVMVSGCCPFIRKETIEKFFFDYLKSDNDGMFGVIEKKNYIWDNDGNLLTPFSTSMNTKEAQSLSEAAHCLYAGKLDDIGHNVWMGDLSKRGDVELWPVPENETMDIDHEWQFELYETLYRSRKGD